MKKKTIPKVWSLRDGFKQMIDFPSQSDYNRT